MTITARVFMSGRSQALRLPAKLRLQATQVRIEPIGNGLWLQPETPPEQDMGRWLQQFYASLGFLPVSGVYSEDGIDHIDMQRAH